MTRDERNRLIEQYAAGYAEVAAAIAGMSDADMRAHPLPGKWSAAEIVHHLADSETQSGIRLRKLLAEEHPVIQGYDQDAWARVLHYNDRPVKPALAAFQAARDTTLQLMRAMTDFQWHHLGWHTESGSFHAETWLAIYALHAHNHAAQIRRLREALGR